MPESTFHPGLPLALAGAYVDGTLTDTLTTALREFGMESLLSACNMFAIDVTRRATTYLRAEDDPEHVSTWFATYALNVLPAPEAGRLYTEMYTEFGTNVQEQTHEIDHTEPGGEVRLTGMFHIGDATQHAGYLTAATEFIHRLLALEAQFRQTDLDHVLAGYRASLAQHTGA